MRGVARVAYGAKDITVLKGLEPVRERPGMYIATRIDVTLLPDGGCRVVDDGRGIPVDNHSEYKNKSAAEVVLTVLHAGGKFGGEGYKISGGLHGVGVSVVNALSSRLDLEIYREGNRWEMSFEKGGKPTDVENASVDTRVACPVTRPAAMPSGVQRRAVPSAAPQRP